MRHLLGILPLLCFMAPSDVAGGPSFDEATKHAAPPDAGPETPTPPVETAPEIPATDSPDAKPPESPAGDPTEKVAPPEDTRDQQTAGPRVLNEKSPMPSDEELAVLRENEVASLASFFHGQLLANSQLSVGRGLNDASVAADYAALAFAQAEAHLAERDKRRVA